MSQMPVGQAKSLLQKAGYSVRMSRKRQGRLIVARGKLSASLAVLHGAVSEERVGRLLELAKHFDRGNGHRRAGDMRRSYDFLGGMEPAGPVLDLPTHSASLPVIVRMAVRPRRRPQQPRRHSAQRQSENIAQDSFNRRIRTIDRPSARTIDRPSALTIARSRPTLIVWSTFPNIW